MTQLDLDRNFPMPDETSARLMIVKAECLRAARVITEAETLTILARALETLEWAIHD